MAMGLIIFIQVICFILCGCAEAEDIIHGKEVQPHCMPYMAFMKIISSKNELSRCGGTLIRDDYVLTAAHCGEGKISVILGVHDITAANDFRQEIEVCNAIKHPKYKPSALKHDIMLLKLKKKAVLSRYVLPLPFDKNNGSVKPGSICTVAGWGKFNTFNDKPSPLLREVDLKVVSNKTCSTFYPKIDIENFICAGEEKEKKNTGKGDSGSPLFCGEYLSGIVLGGQNNMNPPSLFTKVSSYRYWIKTTMEKKKCKNYS